jgi:hypothetical protein
MTENTPSGDLFETLTRFGENQLHDIKARDIHRVTAHLMVATVFFTGATIQLAARRRLPKAVYFPALQRYLSHTFGMPDKNAAGLVESNARLCKRYRLIENIYNQGWRAAKAWQDGDEQGSSMLVPLLRRYHDLSMSTLGREGVKAQPVATPEVEEVAAVAPAPPPAPTRAWGRLVWLSLLLLGAAAAAAYYWLYYH